MKKLSVILFSFMMFLTVSSISFAQGPIPNPIPQSDLAIGGITTGVSESYVKKIYGEPNDITYDSDGYRDGSVKKFNYGNSFFISFSKYGAFQIESTANNGLKTPAGFTVGDPISKVKQYYGSGHYQEITGDEPGVRCNFNWYKYITFWTDRKGKIKRITVMSM